MEMSPTPRVIGRGLDVCIWEPDFPGGQILSVCRFSQRIIGAITTSALEGLTSGLRITHPPIPLKRCSLAVSTENWCRWPERSPAPGWKGQKAPVGHLHRPALFAPWRVMWRPVFPGCHTHSGGFAIHAGRCSCTLGADNGNRTHLRGLGSRRSADELYPRCCPAGVAPGHRSENGERVLTGHAWKVGEYYVRHPHRW